MWQDGRQVLMLKNVKLNINYNTISLTNRRPYKLWSPIYYRREISRRCCFWVREMVLHFIKTLGAFKVLKDFKVVKVIRDIREIKDIKDIKDIRDIRDIKGFKDLND